MKTCNKCNKEKPLSEFYKERASKDGLRGACKSCHNAQMRKWNADNKERHAETNRRWRAANPERNAERVRRWQAKNPRRYAYIQQRTRARQRDIEWGFTYDEWLAKWGDRWEQRGNRRPDQLVMARRGDRGPYSPANTIIITNGLNVKHGNRRKKLAELREAK